MSTDHRGAKDVKMASSRRLRGIRLWWGCRWEWVRSGLGSGNGSGLGPPVRAGIRVVGEADWRRCGAPGVDLLADPGFRRGSKAKAAGHVIVAHGW
jgi:hypothetical protein